jgi:hypothetical protein
LRFKLTLAFPSLLESKINKIVFQYGIYMVTETDTANLNVLNEVVDVETCRGQVTAFFQGPVITQLKAQIPRAIFPLTKANVTKYPGNIVGAFRLILDKFEAYQMRFDLEGVQHIVSNASDTTAAAVLNVSAAQATISTAQPGVSNARSAVSSAEVALNAFQVDASPIEIKSNYSRGASASSMTAFSVSENVKLMAALKEEAALNLVNHARSVSTSATHSFISSARTKELGDALVDATEDSKTACQAAVAAAQSYPCWGYLQSCASYNNPFLAF